jgi:hypothetical protein
MPVLRLRHERPYARRWQDRRPRLDDPAARKITIGQRLRHLLHAGAEYEDVGCGRRASQGASYNTGCNFVARLPTLPAMSRVALGPGNRAIDTPSRFGTFVVV